MINTIKHLYFALLYFDDIGGYGKERENISPQVLYAELIKAHIKKRT